MKRINLRIVTILSLVLFLCSLGTPAFAASTGSYQLNRNNETYGSGLFASSDHSLPDLMLAVGDSGITGYVRTSDLQKEDDSLSDVLAEAVAKPAEAYSYTIPVYEEDGMTVIDSYTVGGVIISTENETRADWATSRPWTNETVNCQGTFTAYIKSGWFNVTGKASVQAHQSMGVGELGAQVHIYRSDGALVASSAMKYSTSATTYYEITYTYNGDAGTYYYAKGALKLWNRALNKYWVFSSNITPNVTPSWA